VESLNLLWEEGKRGAKIKKEFPHLQFHLAQKPQKRAALIKNSTYSVTLTFLQLKSERIHTLIWKGSHKVALLLNEV
jgi:hypothetical protein